MKTIAKVLIGIGVLAIGCHHLSNLDLNCSSGYFRKKPDIAYNDPCANFDTGYFY